MELEENRADINSLRKVYMEDSKTLYKTFGVNMQLLGKVLHLVSRGMVIQSGEAPRLGEAVLDSKKRKIGNVSDIFGPVNSPYLLIKPVSILSRADMEGLVGSDVYMGEKYAGRSAKKGRKQ